MTSQIDNPAAAPAAQSMNNNNERQPPPPAPAKLAIRETTKFEFTGFMMLVPPLAPRYLLVPDAFRKQLQVFDLLHSSSTGVAVLNGYDVRTAALSADGDSICLGIMYTGLRIYDMASLLVAAATLLKGCEVEADNQVVPRARAPNGEGQSAAAGAAFSQDADRLFVLWKSGITVHDPWQPTLPVLRRLAFSGSSFVNSHSMLVCEGGLLAAAAGGGIDSPPPSSSEEARLRHNVQLWRVDANGETELRTVSNPDLADSVALSPNGGLMAVGLRNGAVRLSSPMAQDDDARGEQADVYVQPVAVGKNTGSPMAHMLCFSHDGSKLVAGRAELDDFTVYDVGSAAVVNRFVHPKSRGCSAVFFPADDVLVIGGASQQCVFHRLLPPAPRLELNTSTSITGTDVASGAGGLGSIVAVAAGSELSVHTLGGKTLLRRNLGEELFTSLSKFRTAVRLQPGGKFVACVATKTTVVVLSIEDGTERLRNIVASCLGMWWSPDGILLAVATNAGVRLFSMEEDFAETQRLQDQQLVNACAFDSMGAQLATGTLEGGQLTIWEVATWTPTRTIAVGSLILAVCFSNTGDHLAYQEYDEDRVGVLSLEAKNDSKPQVVFTKVNGASDLKFSPDDNFLLCSPSPQKSFDQHRMRVLDLATGTDAAWGELLRTMALPVVGGTLCGRTMGWTEVLQPAGDTARASPTVPQWMLYGAVGNRLVVTDIEASLRAIEDNAWTPEQLVFCSKYQQELLRSVVEAAPHCSNIRDTETGETVLHLLTRAWQVESLQKLLGACSDVAPVVDNQGLTAVQVAVQLDQVVLAQALWQKVPASITSISASNMMRELRLMSQTHPQLVRAFLLDVEPTIVRTLATFRTELARVAEVCGLSTATLEDGSDDNNRSFEDESMANRIPSIWSDKCPADSSKQLVAWRVVVLPDLLGDAVRGPFHDIVAGCDASVFDSKLLELIVQYKWEENVRLLRMWGVAGYGCACVIATIAMLVSVTSEDVDTSTSRTADVLQGLVVVIEVSSFGLEAFKLVREGTAAYFTTPWNILDAASSSLLMVGSAYHFLRAKNGVRIAGALGAALKYFGLVNYLRPFSATGSLVRMISVILIDMIPFMTVLSIAMLGCTAFFAIHQSRSDSVHDPFSTLVTVYHMSLGIGRGIDTETASVPMVAVVTVFTSFVVVVLLNLLIAIMGDSYEKVKMSERVEAIRERACVIVAMEKRFPNSHRYDRFMHFVEMADSEERPQDNAWEGVTRRVTQVVENSRDTLVDRQHTLADRQDRLEGEMSKLNSKFEGEMSKLNSKFELVDNKLETLLMRLP